MGEAGASVGTSTGKGDCRQGWRCRWSEDINIHSVMPIIPINSLSLPPGEDLKCVSPSPPSPPPPHPPPRLTHTVPRSWLLQEMGENLLGAIFSFSMQLAQHPEQSSDPAQVPEQVPGLI